MFDNAGANISQIGNDDVDTTNVADGQVVCLSAIAETPGILFGYRARIVSTDAMLVLQLWRPVTSSNVTSSNAQPFRLVDEVYYSPSTTGVVDVSHTNTHTHTHTH